MADSGEINMFWNDIQTAPPPLIPGPEELNPFTEDGVEFFLTLPGCGLPGENIKYGTVRGMLDDAYVRGLLAKTHTLIEATSGNTGLELATQAPLKPYKIKRVVLVTNPDLAFGKRGPLVLRGATLIDADRNGPDGEPSTIATARARGGGGWRADDDWHPNDGWLNLDQYGNRYNALYHERVTGPDIHSFMLGRLKKDLTAFYAGIGTGGTIIGVSNYLRNASDGKIRIGGVLCKPKEKIPGVRDRKRMMEITLPWEQSCDIVYEVGTRMAYLTTLWLLWLTLYSYGPSTGFAYVGALLDIHAHKVAGTLDKIRNKAGKVVVAVLAPDTYRPYIDHFHADLMPDWMRRSSAPLPWHELWGKDEKT